MAFLSRTIAEIKDQEYQRIQLELTVDLDYSRTLSRVKQLLKLLLLIVMSGTETVVDVYK